MKIKSQNKKIPVLLSGVFFAVAAVSGVVGVANATFANQAVKITNFTATGNIVINNKNQNNTHMIDSVSLNFDIPNIAQYKAGDYIEFSTENLRLGVHDKDIIAGGKNVAKMKLIHSDDRFNRTYTDSNSSDFRNLRPEESSMTELYRIIFTEEIDNITDSSTPVMISSVKMGSKSAFSNGDYILPIKIKSGDKVIVENSVNISKHIPCGFQELRPVHGGLVSVANNSSISEVFMYFWINSCNVGVRKMAVGDVLEDRITDESSGLVFDNANQIGKIVKAVNENSVSSLNQHGAYHVDTSDYAEFEVIEASPRVMRYRVVKAPINKGFIAPVMRQKYKIIDDSIIDYQNNKLKPIGFSTKYIHSDGVVGYVSNFQQESIITGARLSSQAQFQKRGSIIRQIVDENGDKITGFESDILAFERITVGEKYTIDTPTIEGYEFNKIDTNSIPLSGQIQEGVKTARLIYRKKLPTPAPAAEIKPKTEEPKKVESPNTGLSNPQTLLLPLFGILTAGTYLVIREK